MRRSPRQMLLAFMRHESAAGVLLLLASAAALIIANSGAHGVYEAWLHTKLTVGAGAFSITHSIEHWINDGLMVIFFLLVSLEIKRERLQGQLADMGQAMLPCIAALGGVVVPALIYAALNYEHPEALRGWAVPTATDIAFSLGVMRVLGHRVPLALQIFLTTLAVVDDLAAIVMIAVFYTQTLNLTALAAAAAITAALVLVNRQRVESAIVYILLGLGLWLAVSASGVHATVAGVILGFCVPLQSAHETKEPLLLRWEHGLHPWVAYAILPIFAFANAGLSVAGMAWADVLHPVTLGVGIGLLVGKPLGIVGITWLAVRTGRVRLPIGASWRSLWATGVLGGIGFTMSLFVSSLAYADASLLTASRLGILIGSCAAAVLGYAMFRRMPIAQPYAPN